MGMPWGAIGSGLSTVGSLFGGMFGSDNAQATAAYQAQMQALEQEKTQAGNNANIANQRLLQASQGQQNATQNSGNMEMSALKDLVDRMRQAMLGQG